ncbi:MAG: family serine peptidase [Ferruginibacter sp.]|nr:family serine peptidase [Ferruginibacter sp.]
MKKALVIILLLAAHSNSFGQYSRYIIQLKDKTGTPFSTSSPLQFLTQRAVDRRTRYHIAIDQSDLPVTPRYIDSIRLSGKVTILNISRWLNQVCILTTDATALAKINSFPFVIASRAIAARQSSTPIAINKNADPSTGLVPVPRPVSPQSPADLYNYGAAFPQLNIHNAEFLHNLGFRGEGVQLAIMDDGFYHYKTLRTFDSIRSNNQVLGTWDFVTNDANVDEDDAHGMHCFSTIAANLPGSFVGTAPKSSFYLFRTEDIASEYPVEEQNWAVAAEKADSLGADVFSVSLGYNLFDNSNFNYTYSNMDGNTTIIAKACDLAAKKGILVVVAAGNEGNSSWKYITTPADADSVLTVGAVNAAGQVAGFSSYGPSADGQVKPDVAAIGANAVIADQNTGAPTFGNGTSYACPILAGIVTCLWQAFPEVNNMSIIEATRNSSNKANTPDDRSGYGIPNAKKAFVLLIKKLYTQQINVDTNCRASIHLTLKAGANMSVGLERKLSTDTGYIIIATKSYTGNFAPVSFNYSDDLAFLQTGNNIQYRLKMTIGTDTSFYLDSAFINYTQPCTNINPKITIRPIPVTDQLTVTVSGNNPIKAGITIHSITGQKIFGSEELVTGVRTISIPMKQMSRGVYVITLYLNGKKEVVKKFIKE